MKTKDLKGWNLTAVIEPDSVMVGVFDADDELFTLPAICPDIESIEPLEPEFPADEVLEAAARAYQQGVNRGRISGQIRKMHEIRAALSIVSVDELEDLRSDVQKIRDSIGGSSDD